MSKIVALIAFRNEELFLPGCLHHLRDFVDEIICLDDCSTDKSAEIAAAEPKVTMLKSGIEAPNHANEVRNRRSLLYEAYKRHATFVVCCDADERFETAFLSNLRKLSETPHRLTVLHVRDLWNSPFQYRVDGVWAGKAKTVAFPIFGCPTCHAGWHLNAIHTPWYPPFYQKWPKEMLDFNVYHLRSITPELRQTRVLKFKEIDPIRNNDGHGYDYLNDETGLIVETIPIGKEYAL